MVLYTRVLKEPRGFVRIIQCILAILAFSLTAGFDTSCQFSHKCLEEGTKDKMGTDVITYSFGYPFHFKDNVLTVPAHCDDENGNGGNDDHNGDDEDDQTLILPFDFSSTAEFFVATGVITFLYTLIALFVYVFLHQQYSTNPKIPVIDLGISSVLAMFWLAGSSAWARAVEDLKYYLHPENLFGFIKSCGENEDACKVIEDGHWAELNVSLIFGFTCVAIWLASLWFVYKETVFHTPAEATGDVTQNQNAKGDGRV